MELLVLCGGKKPSSGARLMCLLPSFDDSGGLSGGVLIVSTKDLRTLKGVTLKGHHTLDVDVINPQKEEE